MSDTSPLDGPAQTSARRRLWRLVALGALALGLVVGPLGLTAHAEGNAASFVVAANLTKDGALKVEQTITFTGPVPAEVSQKIETRENLIGNREYELTLSGISASAKGKAISPDVSPAGRFTTISVATGGATEIVVSYTVVGAVVRMDGGGTALRWRLLQGLSAPVTAFSGTVQIPSDFSYVSCTAGAPNSTTPCAFAASGVENAQVPTFRDGPRGEGEVVAIDVGFPAGAVAANERIDDQWTLGRAFSAKPLPLALALGLLVLGGLGLLALHRRAGRDAHFSGQVSKAGEFVPVGPGVTEFRVVGDVRPGHVGTIVDERVDPIDITASLLDLAVRGYLLITELPRTSTYSPTDWTLTRLERDPAALTAFEQKLLDGLAPVGASLPVSELSQRVQQSIGEVQDQLYDEMVTRGWYERRPDATRDRWTQLALGGLIIAVVITGVLAAFTTYGLVGLVLVALGLGTVFVGQEMPARTAKGSALVAGLGALRSDLLSHPTDQMPPGAELRELSEVLPYAVVLGGADRWLNAIVSTDTEEQPDSHDLSWFHGPDDWHLRDLPGSLRSFITTVSGGLFSR